MSNLDYRVQLTGFVVTTILLMGLMVFDTWKGWYPTPEAKRREKWLNLSAFLFLAWTLQMIVYYIWTLE
jgi:hypothetical protein